MVPSEGVNLEGGKVLLCRRYSVRANSFRQSSEPRTSQPFLGWNRDKTDDTAEYRSDCRPLEIKKNNVGRL